MRGSSFTGFELRDKLQVPGTTTTSPDARNSPRASCNATDCFRKRSRGRPSVERCASPEAAVSRRHIGFNPLVAALGASWSTHAISESTPSIDLFRLVVVGNECTAMPDLRGRARQFGRDVHSALRARLLSALHSRLEQLGCGQLRQVPRLPCADSEHYREQVHLYSASHLSGARFRRSRCSRKATSRACGPERLEL